MWETESIIMEAYTNVEMVNMIYVYNLADRNR